MDSQVAVPRVSEKCSAVGTGYPRARRALHVEQRCSTLAPVGRLGRRKLAASLARRATIFDRISKDFAPPKPQNFLRAAPYGRGRPTAGALRARRPTARYPRSDLTSETRMIHRAISPLIGRIYARADLHRATPPIPPAEPFIYYMPMGRGSRDGRQDRVAFGSTKSYYLGWPRGDVTDGHDGARNCQK